MVVQSIQDIIRYLKEGKYPKNVKSSLTKKRNFRRKCHGFEVKHNNLFKKTKSGGLLKFVNDREKYDIIKNLHVIQGGHLGVNKT